MSAPARPLAPGQLLGGRYRLLAAHGAGQRGRWEFWRAQDQLLGRDVAVSVLRGDPTDPSSVETVRRVRGQLSRASTVGLGAITQLFDALGNENTVQLGQDVLAVVVSAWTPGRDLLDVLAEGPVPVALACRMLLPLVDDVSSAHEAGAALGIDGANRIRCAEDGTLALSFLGPSLSATASEDVEAVVSLLHLLLTGIWPDSAADPVRLLDQRCPDLPRELALVIMLSLRPGPLGSVRTIGPLRRALTAALVSGPTIPAQKPRQRSRISVRRALEPIVFHGRRAIGRSRRLAPAALLAVATLIVFLTGATPTTLPPIPQSTARGASGQTPVHRPSQPRLTTPATHAPATAPPGPTQRPLPVVPSEVSEYLVRGTPDNPAQLGHVIDNNAATAWSTDQYWQQLPALVPGIGIMVGFGQPVAPSEVDVDSNSAGTVVQIRTAETTTTRLENTGLLATATLSAGTTVIPLLQGRPARNLLVWITHLAGANGVYQSTIKDLRCQGSPPTS